VAVTILLLGLLIVASAQEPEFELPEPPVAFGRAPLAPFDTGAVDYLDYDISVRLVPVRHYLEGTTRVVFRNRASRLGHVDFVLYNDTLRILRVARGGRPLAFDYNPSTWTLSVQLSDTLGPGEEDTVEIDYRGYITPALSSSLSNYCRLDAGIGFSILPYVWYPAPYDYYYGGRRDERVQYRTTITVPAGWHGIGCETRLDSTGTDTSRTYTWQTARPTVAAAFGAGPFRLSRRDIDGLPVRYYDYDTSAARNVFAAAGSSLGYLNRTFGRCTLEQLNYAENLQVYGSANRGLVMQPLPYQLSGIVHETSHQWWGVAVPPRYRSEVWLNEGFASYSEALVQEDTFGRYVRWAELDTMARRYLAVPRNQDRPIVPAPTGSNYYFTIVYNKGAWVLHMLRWVLGESAFFRTLRTYADRYRDSSVTVADFRAVAEEVSGRGLDWFFDQWLYHTGAPQYVATWWSDSLGPDRHLLTVAVRQYDSLFSMTLPLSIFTGAAREDRTVWVSRAADTVQFLRATRTDSIRLDYDDWILDRGIVVTSNREPTGPPPPERLAPTIVRGVLELGRLGHDTDSRSGIGSCPAHLLDIAGRKVMALQPGANDVSRLAPGVYFVREQLKHQAQEVRRVIVTR
jgi:aminopeptidase N